jgi:BolA protein
MPVAGTVEELERRLKAAFGTSEVAVVDDSARHVGHAGAASGGGHYNVRIVSPRFAGLNRVGRHRLVYDPLADLMRHAVHALSIEALTPDEVSAASTGPASS